MTPAARIAAAMDLRALTEKAGTTDREVLGFFRNRRYAGSKDRAAITQIIYDLERRQALLRYHLGESAPARLQVLSSVVLSGTYTSEQLNALCGGDKYAGAALTSEEIHFLRALEQKKVLPVPDWVVGNYPAWLEDELRHRFGDHLLSELRAFQKRAPFDLRANILLGERDSALAALTEAGLAAEPSPLSPWGIRLQNHPRIDQTAPYKNGLVEPQDEGSQIAALMVDAKPEMRVLDLCAGAGGKTLALAAAMHNRGELIAADNDPSRLDRLEIRAQRARATIVRRMESHKLEALGQFDRVLVDAPCSGSGTWRRQPGQAWRLTPDHLTRDIAIQRQLLDKAATLTKPGGRLIYVTCSLLPCENERQIEHFLSNFPNFALYPLSDLLAAITGLRLPEPKPWLSLTPKQQGTDGFFVTALVRNQ